MADVGVGGELSVVQFLDQLGWLGVGECVEYVPALLSGGMDDGAEGGEALCAVGGAEAAGDFLAELDHSEIAFGLVVGEGDLGGVSEEAQAFCLSFPVPCFTMHLVVWIVQSWFFWGRG